MKEFQEREYIKKVASFQTIMPIICSYCKTEYDQIDGKGSTEISHGCCNDCLPKMKEDLMLL